MRRNIKIVFALLLVGLSISCKDKSAETDMDSVSEMAVSPTDTTAVISSSAAVVNSNDNRKFVRTADIRFKVKNVTKSTEVIENATKKFGGFVTYTNLQSNISDEDKTEVSPDSTLVTTKYTVENEITIRVPNTKLDTVIKSIASQIGFLNHRVIKADDVSLQMLSNKLAQKRNSVTEDRIAKAIDNKGKKLNQVIDAEENLANKKEVNDAKSLENLSLQDQVDFSTIALQIYQDASVKQELVANERSINDFRPHIGLQIVDSLKTGWFMLEHIISFIVLLWPFALIGSLGYLGYQRYLKVK